MWIYFNKWLVASIRHEAWMYLYRHTLKKTQKETLKKVRVRLFHVDLPQNYKRGKAGKQGGKMP